MTTPGLPPSALAPHPPPSPLPRPGFRAGIAALFGGYRHLLGTPEIWPLALVPVAVALVLAVVFGGLAVAGAPRFVAAIVGEHEGALWTALVVALQILVTALALALALALSFALAKPISGPALERIVRRVEADLGAPGWPPTSFLEDVGRSLQSSLVSFGFGVPLLGLLALVSFVFAPASVVTVPLQIVVTGILIAWDLCDFPLSIRGVSVGKRIDFMRENIGAVLGFGVGLALLSFLPCTLLLVLPAGVIGAARLTVEIERWEGRHREG
jgi:CysZ protein